MTNIDIDELSAILLDADNEGRIEADNLLRALEKHGWQITKARATLAAMRPFLEEVTEEMVEAWEDAYPSEDLSQSSDAETNLAHARANWLAMLNAKLGAEIETMAKEIKK